MEPQQQTSSKCQLIAGKNCGEDRGETKAAKRYDP